MINTGLLPLSLGIFMMILHGIALMHTDKINPFDLLNKPVQMYQIQLKKPKTSPKKPIKKPQPKPIKKPPPKKAPPKQPPPPSKKTASIPSPNIQETPPPTVHATQLNQAVTPIQPILPQYPEVAKKAGIEAQLYVEVIIDEKGRVAHSKILHNSQPDYGFEESALRAVNKLRFTPIKQNDQPVKVKLIYPIQFVLIE